MPATQARKNKQTQAPDGEAMRLRLRWLSGAGLLLVLVAAASAGVEWVVDPLHTPLRQVEIRGELRHLDRAALEREVVPLLAGGFFGASVEAIQARVEAQPWVDQVSVRRLWPDRLRLRISEHKAVARWGETALLNGRGDVFVPTRIPVQYLDALPVLDGPEGHAPQVLASYRRMMEMLKGLGLAISDLRQNERRSWRMTLSNGTQVQLGRVQPERRLARFMRAYPAILASAGHRVEAVDLRYSNGFTVRWSSEIQEQQAG
jgi:cell division protein FtsQ